MQSAGVYAVHPPLTDMANGVNLLVFKIRIIISSYTDFTKLAIPEKKRWAAEEISSAAHYDICKYSGLFFFGKIHYKAHHERDENRNQAGIAEIGVALFNHRHEAELCNSKGDRRI